MGIRYYAYAFDNDQTDHALADPAAFISSDPLADAWGFERHAVVTTPRWEQAVPEKDMLYLDKLWQELQLLTSPAPEGTPTRPAYRMFEGTVTMSEQGWWPWYRALAPVEMAPIADDLAVLEDELVTISPGSMGLSEQILQDTRHFLRRARTFTEGLVVHGRGMVYTIG
jgi:hypothetical protein